MPPAPTRSRTTKRPQVAPRPSRAGSSAVSARVTDAVADAVASVTLPSRIERVSSVVTTRPYSGDAPATSAIDKSAAGSQNRSPVPRVSVVVRSYNRIPALCELLDVLLGQDHDSFEVIVVDPSTDVPAADGARLGVLERDYRLRVLRFPPLGGARARNTGVAATRGEIVVLVDDDDLPVGADFLRLMEQPFRDDAGVVGVTCRHYWGDVETISAPYRWLAARRCMRFSPVLKLPFTYPRY